MLYLVNLSKGKHIINNDISRLIQSSAIINDLGSNHECRRPIGIDESCLKSVAGRGTAKLTVDSHIDSTYLWVTLIVN